MECSSPFTSLRWIWLWQNHNAVQSININYSAVIKHCFMENHCLLYWHNNSFINLSMTVTHFFPITIISSQPGQKALHCGEHRLTENVERCCETREDVTVAWAQRDCEQMSSLQFKNQKNHLPYIITLILCLIILHKYSVCNWIGRNWESTQHNP